MHCFSINYTFAQVGGKIWVGTIIDFCACKNMFTCLSCCCKVSACTKTCSYAFLCHCKVFAPAKTYFYCDVGWLEGCCAASSCSVVGPNTALLWQHWIPAPPTGGMRPPPSQSAACGEPVHNRRHAATPSTTGGPTSQRWICAWLPHHPLSLPPGGASSLPLPPNGVCLL